MSVKTPQSVKTGRNAQNAHDELETKECFGEKTDSVRALETAPAALLDLYLDPSTSEDPQAWSRQFACRLSLVSHPHRQAGLLSLLAAHDRHSAHAVLEELKGRMAEKDWQKLATLARANVQLSGDVDPNVRDYQQAERSRFLAGLYFYLAKQDTRLHAGEVIVLNHEGEKHFLRIKSAISLYEKGDGALWLRLSALSKGERLYEEQKLKPRSHKKAAEALAQNLVDYSAYCLSLNADQALAEINHARTLLYRLEGQALVHGLSIFGDLIDRIPQKERAPYLKIVSSYENHHNEDVASQALILLITSDMDQDF